MATSQYIAGCVIILEDRTTLWIFLSEEEEVDRFLNLSGFEWQDQDSEDGRAYLVVLQDFREIVFGKEPTSCEKIAAFGCDQKLLIYSTSTAQ